MNTIKNILAEIVLFTIYITMRVVHCLSFWHPFPRYSDWKVCTEPNYQTKHMKEFIGIYFQALLICAFWLFFPFWWSVLFGVVALNVVLFAIWLIRKL